MLDINELRRKLGSDDLIDHIDIHANVKPALTELLGRIEVAEKDIALKERVIDSLGSALNAAANERDALRTELAVLRSSMTFRTSLIGRIEAERDALQAKVEAMERPVAAIRSIYGAQPAPSIPEGWKLAPIEVVDLYSFMCSAFTPMTPQQDQIAIQLDLAKRAMLTSSLGLVDQAMTRSAAIRVRGEPDAP